ncbi:MAG: hypothetical protein JO270_07485 [Acidobacteriaceae bacterium]|nr:hypothetical protein [Acidobacteriaceae bacterium]
MQKHLIFSAALAVQIAAGQSGVPAIPTGQYNSSRTAATLNETILTPSNVNSTQFGKLFSWTVDGQVFAQPLYVPGVMVNGSSTNVVYVATMNNSVYAFNADSSGNTPLWYTNFGTPVTAPTTNSCPNVSGTGPQLGILGTPVIDPATNTLYAVSASPYGVSTSAKNGTGYLHYLHAIDITTGKEKSGSPVLIQASVPGNGYDAQNGKVSLNPSSTDIQRPALLFANGTVYAAFGGCGPDPDPWHGWVIGYRYNGTFSQTAVFNSTPNGGQGGIWQSGRGLVADSAGNVYFNTGNSTNYRSADANITTGDSTKDASNGNYPMRFVELNSAGQFVASYPPADYAALNNYDLDFASSGPLNIPDTNLFVTGGKDGVIYLFNSNNLSGVQSFQVLQSFQATGGKSCTFSMSGCDQIHHLAFWNNTLYVWGSNDLIRAYTFSPSSGTFNATASSIGNVSTTYPPASFAVSGNSNAAGTGIVWAFVSDSSSTGATLYALNAANVATQLWNSNQNAGRDALPSFPRFTTPTIANGRVYAATHSNQVVVYGELSDFSVAASAPTLSVLQNSKASMTATVTALKSLGSAVNLSVTGLPPGASATFNPPSLSSSGSSTLTINAASSTPTGTYPLLVEGTEGGIVRSANVALTVTTPDTTPPQWTCCSYTQSGNSYVLGFTAWDTQSGLKSIIATEVVDAQVSIPTFPVGTNNVINFTETETDTSSYVVFQLTDVAGNVAMIDPIFVDAARVAGRPVPITVKDVMPQLGVITIENGTPGLKNVRIGIDYGLVAVPVEVAGLKDGEQRVVDITALIPQGGATVTITPLGKPGGTGVFIFASSPMTGGTQ